MIIFLGGYLENNISQYNIYKAEGKEEINLVIGSCDAAFDEPVTERGIYQGLLEKLGTHGQVAFAYNGSILGYVAFYANQTAYAYISLIAVNPEQQNMHIGKQLLAYCESIAQENGIEMIQLEVRKDNQNAICFYHRNGFVWIQDKDEDSCYMKKQLSR